jgi:methionyl aminopeptidase
MDVGDGCRAASAARAGVRSGLSSARAGVTTAQIAEAVRASLDAHGVITLDAAGVFTHCCAVSVNEVAAGGVPDERRLDAGDVVTVDVACAADGWWADVAGSVAVPGLDAGQEGAGRVAGRAARLVAAADGVLGAMLSACRAGVRWGAVVEAGRTEAASRSVTLLRAFGAHGLSRPAGAAGLGLSDARWALPHASPAWASDPGSPAVLTEGLVLAIEPVVVEGPGGVLAASDPARAWESRTAGGAWAAGSEETVVVGKEGVWVAGVGDFQKGEG